LESHPIVIATAKELIMTVRNRDGIASDSRENALAAAVMPSSES
jgi:hypothetical protein